MFQIGQREKGECLFNCPNEKEVVKFTKDGQTVNLCRKHLWQALSNGTPDRKRGGKEAESKA